MNLLNSYWTEKGKYKYEYTELWKYVPIIGYADNKYLDALIAMHKMYYDLHDNGLCNKNILQEDLEKYLNAVKDELNVSEKTFNNVVGEPTSLEEPKYIGYYEGYIEDMTEEDYKDYELLMDAAIKLAWKNKDSFNHLEIV